MKAAKGTVEHPGTNVKAKSGLNREIAGQTWGLLCQQLTYKAAWAGRRMVVVNPLHTSQECSRCGVVDPKSRKGKVFGCTACGLLMDADHNAALNILGRSMSGGNDPPQVLEPVSWSLFNVCVTGRGLVKYIIPYRCLTCSWQ